VRRTILAAVVAGLLCGALAPARAAEPVDLALVLAIDVSGSIDAEEAALQRQGYLAALTDARVLRAIASGAHGAIALTYVEWAGADYQRTVVPWTVVRGADDAARVVATLNASPPRTAAWTSISGALDYARAALAASGVEPIRQVIDISGDGRNNSGRPAEAARDAAVAAGITINGLPILNDRPNFGRPPERDVDQYYEQHVIGGPGAFLIVATDFKAFADAILSKLIKEIAADAPRDLAARMR